MSSNPWLRGLKLIDINNLKEGQSTGALSQRLKQLYDTVDEDGNFSQVVFSIDPGDWNYSGEGLSFALSLPVAYDIWYLWQTVNIWPTDKELQKLYTDIILKSFFDKLKNIQPLRTVNRDTLQDGDTPDLNFFDGKGYSLIKEMRYETFLYNQSPMYPSNGPQCMDTQEINLEDSDIYCGYLVFPIGPLGVMRVLSVVSESLLNDPTFQAKDSSCDPQNGGELFPPQAETGDSCFGKHLIEKAYLISDNDTEYPAKTMEQSDEILPHHWMRHWLRKDACWPMPGEFIGLLAKPLSLPPHCWWFQETSPFLYSGNFFETDYYTSGIVLAVIEKIKDEDEEHPEDKYEVTEISGSYSQLTGIGYNIISKGEKFNIDGFGAIYKVRVKDEDIYLKSTDFLSYQVDERVAIIKRTKLPNTNFLWSDLSKIGSKPNSNSVDDISAFYAQTAGIPFQISYEWVIVPITFYEGS